jgi:cephalosporin hydroxylase
VEIGSYCGRSTVFLAEAAADAGVTVFAVDPHQGNPEMAPGRECHHPEVWTRENGSLSVLLDSVADHPNVVPVVSTGHRFAESGVRPGFVFIDADHSYQGCKADWELWSERCDMIAMHDTTDMTGPGIVRDAAIAAGWTLEVQVESLAVLSR